MRNITRRAAMGGALTCAAGTAMAAETTIGVPAGNAQAATMHAYQRTCTAADRFEHHLGMAVMALAQINGTPDAYDERLLYFGRSLLAARRDKRPAAGSWSSRYAGWVDSHLDYVAALLNREYGGRWSVHADIRLGYILVADKALGEETEA